MKSNQKKKKQKLNENLCPDKFKLCVPQKCELLGKWDTKDAWIAYLKELNGDGELPPEYKEPRSCWTCDCQLGWELRGELAIAHACRVHDRIHRQALGLEQVSAIDVGFAIWERQAKFGDFLAIRIHVNKKRLPEQLIREGLASFTLPYHALARPLFDVLEKRWFDLPGDDSCLDCSEGPHPDCEHPEKWVNLMELLKRELGERHRLLSHLGRYPISGVRREDLSIFCPLKIAETRTLDDIRLCVCGVPIDVINAHYDPSIAHPGGDADSGVFVEPSQRSDQLSDEEQRLIGRGRVNPLVGGISVGSVTGQAGTLGAIVWDRTDGTPCVLSNWHVLAGTGTAQVGQPTYQPALFDGGTEDDVVAHLKRWRLGEEGDAALAELAGSRHHASGEILGLWHPISGYMRPRLNMEIRKWGRTTGFTQGFVDGIHLATNIDYGNGVVRFFKNQFHIAPLFAGDDVSQVGDSGSLVVTSFRPIELRENLAKLCDWLRVCCEGQGLDILCAEIPCTLEKLLDECNKIPSCSQVCKILSSVKVKPYCTKKDRTGLYGHIEETRKALIDPCKSIKEQIAYCAWAEEALERIYEKCCRKLDWSSEALAAAEQIALELEIAPVIKGFKIKQDRKQQAKAKNPLDFCPLIAQLLKLVKAKCAELKKCAELCGRTTEALESWKQRLDKIPESEKLSKKLCLILETKCKSATCKKPSELVECIETGLECISRIESESKDDDELIEVMKCILERLFKPEETENSAIRRGARTEVDPFVSKYETSLSKIGYDPENPDDWFLQILKGKLSKEPESPEKDWFLQVLKDKLSKEELLNALIDYAKKYFRELHDEKARDRNRVYYAVGMIFAGDTPGSPFGEFAVASDITSLAERLRFSLRPVFEPRSSFRELRVRPERQRQGGRALRSRRSLTPGDQSADPRGGGPQPDLEPSQSDSGSGGN